MRAVIQRVSNAYVDIEGDRIAEIGRGLLVLLGIERSDDRSTAEKMARKIKELRVFPGPSSNIDLSIEDIDGEILVVSQFTLCADVSRGRRPSFSNAAPPGQAEEIYDHFCSYLKSLWGKVKEGRFGAMMMIGLVNEGPVTLVIDLH
jgi:D-tyrosyl-tRNA(Tyr) deacylase